MPGRSYSELAEIVLGVADRGRPGRLFGAVAMAVIVHGAVGLWAIERDQSLGEHVVGPPRQTVIEIAETRRLPSPAPIQPEPESKREVRGAGARPRRPAMPATVGRAPVPAQAGSILARAKDTDDVVDLTDNSFVIGSAGAYAGGVTATSGTSTVGADGNGGEESSRRAGRATDPDQSRGVSLANVSWSCPWPDEADAQQIHEQTVVIYVVVAADGTAEAAKAATDPGHGFASAAVSCALRTRFTPALDRTGRAVRSTSPPIKVRFTR